MPTEDSVSNEPPEEVGWSHHAQDVAEAEETARIGDDPGAAPPQAMRQTMPLGRFLVLLVVVCVAFALLIYFIWGR